MTAYNLTGLKWHYSYHLTVISTTNSMSNDTQVPRLSAIEQRPFFRADSVFTKMIIILCLHKMTVHERTAVYDDQCIKQ